MPKSPKQPDDPEEYKRFLETAKKVDADKRPESFDRAFEKVVSRKPDHGKPPAK